MGYGNSPYALAPYAGSRVIIPPAPLLPLKIWLSAPWCGWRAKEIHVNRSAQSLAPIYVDVSSLLPDGSNIDPTAATVKFAFLPLTDSAVPVPTSGTSWLTGSWFSGGAGYTAQIMAGPSAPFVPVAGQSYAVYLQILRNPAQPVLAGGFASFY